MEISSATLAAREQMLNRATVGQDMLQKTLEKSEEAKQLQQQDKPQDVRKPEADKQGRIDLYA
jgi:hypothetical protein